MRLLTQNSELRPHLVWNWSIPAWYTRLDDGTLFKTCPSAGGCAQVCYARNGTYLFPAVAEAHRRNLMLVLNDRDRWRRLMLRELSHRRFRPRGRQRIVPHGVKVELLDAWLRRWIHHGGAAIRIHDSGDFFAPWYLAEWAAIADANRDVLFYAYTKEVEMMRAHGALPRNFKYLFSTGGLQDHLIEPADRHADVFPDADALHAAGYLSQAANDLLAILLPTPRIGIVANNIPHFNKRLAGRRFSQIALPQPRRADRDNQT